ncbi:uncharacterized protein LOC113469651 [Diaphorina citri]|uniref:Uncharacterized protein LOC113469651 n=1 Tax=Diaphorina citri TaxID=121845 RepID=A0A3Q0J494_DIACI|nr:uncharacterized protein LOC113469651 [Diaphorina citri]
MVHNLLPQVSITLKTMDNEDMSEMLKPEVVLSNGNENGNSLTVEAINGDEEDEREEKGREEEEDDDMNYPMNFLELNVEPQEDSNDHSANSPNVQYKEEHNGEVRGSGSGSSSQEMLQCPLCGQRFPTRTHLLLHTSTQHGLPTFMGDDSVEITPQINTPPAR